ncbi:MAG: hypothetical protein QM537_08545, partial [Candidatus Symbiobacter sp.]|nr:hypothetical protein [Candidatus Symbiobacter sp.]
MNASGKISRLAQVWLGMAWPKKPRHFQAGRRILTWRLLSRPPPLTKIIITFFGKYFTKIRGAYHPSILKKESVKKESVKKESVKKESVKKE